MRRNVSRSLPAWLVAWMAPVVACSSFSTGASNNGGDSGTTTTTADASAGEAGADGAAVAAANASCKALLDRDRMLATKDGIYEIQTIPGGGAASVIKVYCDFTIDGGGWTLVGRSAAVANDAFPFGWSSATGNVERIDFPYSLNVASAKIAFREVLVAERDPGSTKPVGQAFKFGVPVDFMERRDVAVATGAVTKVQGACTPGKATEPEMLRFAGGTALDDVFFLRDFSNLGVHNGLRPSQFNLAWNDCQRGGDLHQRQGMLFVR